MALFGWRSRSGDGPRSRTRQRTDRPNAPREVETATRGPHGAFGRFFSSREFLLRSLYSCTTATRSFPRSKTRRHPRNRSAQSAPSQCGDSARSGGSPPACVSALTVSNAAPRNSILASRPEMTSGSTRASRLRSSGSPPRARTPSVRARANARRRRSPARPPPRRRRSPSGKRRGARRRGCPRTEAEEASRAGATPRPIPSSRRRSDERMYRRGPTGRPAVREGVGVAGEGGEPDLGASGRLGLAADISSSVLLTQKVTREGAIS